MLGVLERIMRTSKEIIVLEKMTGEMILEFCTTKNMGLDNTLFKKRESNQVLCESEPSKMKLDYCLVWKDQIKFVKDIKVPSSETYIIHHKYWYVTL